MTTEDKTKLHDSDCALHNMPAYPNGECNCSLFSKTTTEKAAIKLRTLANQLDTTIGQSEFFFALAENIEAMEKLIRAQEARIAALTKDAERYRWLRNQHDIHDPLARVVWWNQPTGMLTFTWIETVNSKNLDESIDAAKEQV